MREVMVQRQLVPFLLEKCLVLAKDIMVLQGNSRLHKN